MDGYAGKILHANLSKPEVTIKDLPEDMCRGYIGGKGFGAKILFEKSKPKVDPLDPANLLIFATGPVNGLPISGASKACAVFKSPLTGIWSESQCGGFFATHLKFAGYDVVTIQGRSEKPVYITIDDEEVIIRDAEHLWGKDCYETEDIIKKDHGESFRVVSIGPAGENLVKYSCAGHDKGRQFGRCGIGAVMGSKKVKAIAVRGSGFINISREDELKRF